jgi:hypothetical protein
MIRLSINIAVTLNQFATIIFFLKFVFFPAVVARIYTIGPVK